VLEQWGDDAGAEGWQLANRLAGIVREEDRTRPVSAGFNAESSGYNGFQHALDAIGYNYRINEYARFRSRNPTVPLFGAETASALSSRGVYFFPVSDDKLDPASRADFQVSSYDLYAAPWATPPDWEWRAADAVAGYAGEFVWTGFDYLGEPTPYNADLTNLLNFSDPAEKERQKKLLENLGSIPTPSRSSYFGIVDLAGFPKDRYYWYQARWRPELPMAHLLPHWTWPERVGEITPIHAYTSGDEAELFLNGQSLGRKKLAKGEYRLRWDDVKYTPGEVRLVAYKTGAKWAEAIQRTAGPVARIKLMPDRREISADGQDLSFITVRMEDADGVLVPRAANRVAFSVTGPGEIIATDNGDPTSFESFQSKERAAFNGLVLVVIRSKPGASGSMTLQARSEGLAAEITLTAK
jgi:beta-galactosidase